MKNFCLLFVAMLTLSTNVKAQAVDYPQMDLYDSGMMNMYLDALSNTAHKRKELFIEYSKIAYDFFVKKDYNNFLKYSDYALNTNYYTPELYYLRGYAYEMLGNYKLSRKEYKTAYKYGYIQAKDRLNQIKNK